MMSSQFYKTKLCPWYEKGKCLKGLLCNYAHSQAELKIAPDLRKTSMCRDFQRGQCSKPASQCPFAHHADELRSTEDYLKTTICKAWLKGHCPAGNECRYAHGEQERRERPMCRVFPIATRPDQPASLYGDGPNPSVSRDSSPTGTHSAAFNHAPLLPPPGPPGLPCHLHGYPASTQVMRCEVPWLPLAQLPPHTAFPCSSRGSPPAPLADHLTDHPLRSLKRLSTACTTCSTLPSPSASTAVGTLLPREPFSRRSSFATLASDDHGGCVEPLQHTYSEDNVPTAPFATLLGLARASAAAILQPGVVQQETLAANAKPQQQQQPDLEHHDYPSVDDETSGVNYAALMSLLRVVAGEELLTRTLTEAAHNAQYTD